MLLTFNIKHGRDLSVELEKARKVAEYAIEHNSRTSADVKQIGLKSVISGQIVRKYSRNRLLKRIGSVQLTVPGQGIKVDDIRKTLYISCLKLRLDISYLPKFEKVNQIELDKEYAHVTVTISEPPVMEVEQWVGIDLNSTGHIAVVANPTTGKVQKYGKEARTFIASIARCVDAYTFSATPECRRTRCGTRRIVRSRTSTTRSPELS